MGDEFVVKAVLKRGVKRGVLPVVYLFLLVVFMAVILAVPVSAVKLIGTVSQPTAGSIIMWSYFPIYYESAERSFTTGNNSHGYVLDEVLVVVSRTLNNANVDVIQPTVSIYTSNNGTLGSKVYDLTGNFFSTGFRYFTAPPGVVLNASTTYYLRIMNGGTDSYIILGVVGTGVDSDPAIGWSLGGSTYTRYNGSETTVDGGLAISLYGSIRPNSRPSGHPSISGAAPGGVVQVGLALTADTSGISDSDGITPGSFRYQWFRDNGSVVNISGANGSTYTVVSDDLGSYLFVRVWFVDGYGSDEGPLASGVTGRVMPKVNNPPSFSSVSTFSVNENSRTVGTVVASDVDGEDSVVGYSVSGGVDSARFSITNAGVLSFVSVPDFEVPVDVGGDNVYDLVVTVTSGVGDRVRTANQSVTVTVRDVDENFLELVSNLGRSSHTEYFVDDGTTVLGQSFTTGSDSGGYVFAGVTVDITDSSSAIPLLSIYRSSGGNPGSRLYNLSGSARSAGLQFFMAPSGSVLAANTKYFLRIARGGGSDSFAVGRTSSDDENSGAAAGWSIGDKMLIKSGVSWVESSPSVMLAVHGRSTSAAVGKPVITGVVRVGEVLAVDVSGINDSDGVPSSFVYQWVRVDGGSETDISGAVGGTYRVVSVDEGKKLKVEVSFVDGGGFSEGPLVSVVTGTVAPEVVNSPPVFTSSSSFFVNENLLSVGAVVADDSDVDDNVTGYRVSGGVDASLFDLTSAGVLSFVSVPNYESPQDNGTDNIYALEVEVTKWCGQSCEDCSPGDYGYGC